jgi:type II secretory pathway component PulF
LRQLAVMLASGVPLRRALRTLAVMARGRPAQALDDMVRLVERGEKLSAAMEHSRLFTGLQCGMVAIGEEICFLHQVLECLASLAEREQAAARRLTAALTYPSMVLAAMGLMILFLGQLLAGPLAEVASSLGGGSVLLLALARAAGSPLTLLAVPLAAAAGVGWLGRAWSSPSGRRLLEALLLRWPLVGPLLREAETARLARLLGGMAATGLTLDRALGLASRGTASPAARQALEEAHRRILEGESLARALEASGYFPRQMVHLVAAGERAGRLPELLARVADYAEFRLKAATDTAAAALEPLLVGILGLGVGLVLLLVFAPIYQAISQL